MTTPEPQVSIAERLREALNGTMSQRELARRMASDEGSSPESERRQILKYLSGEHAPTVERAERMAAILGVPADSFVDSRPERVVVADYLREIASTVDSLSRLVENREEAGAPSGDVGRLERHLARLARTVALLAKGQAQIAEALDVQLDDAAPSRAQQSPRSARPKQRKRS